MLARVQLDDSSARILIVDDDADDVHLMRNALRELATSAVASFEVLHAWDGVDALEKLGAWPDEDLPAIVLLDLNMPRMGGVETLRRLRADRRLTDLKVVVVTTSAEPDMQAFAEKLGADSGHVKPDSRRDLVDLMRSIMQNWLPRKGYSTG